MQIGFEPSATVHLTVQPKDDFGRSPDNCLNAIVLNFSGSSRWLTLEFPLSWEEFRNAHRFQLGVYAQSDRPVVGEAVLRLPGPDGDTVDHRFADFLLADTARSAHQRGEFVLPDLSRVDANQRPKLILFFDTKANLTLRIDYLTVYFA